MTADLILCNANVLTLDTNYPRAQLVAIRDGKILTVGGNGDLKEFKGLRTTVVDCQGKTILPGFNDAHCHFVALAKSLVNLNLGPAKVHSIFDMQKEIRELAQNLSPGSWIRADGYNEFYLAEKRHPTRWDLDKATSNHPIKLTHRSGHAHVLNSLALALVGISRETFEPPGGIIERDLETGEPNGLLYDMGDFLAKRVPPLDDSELSRGIKLASQELLSMGITSIQDASPENDLQRWRMFQQWKEDESLKCRVSLMLGMEGFNQLVNCHSDSEFFALCHSERSEESHRSGQAPRPRNLLFTSFRASAHQDKFCEEPTTDSGIHLGGVKIILQETTGRLSPAWEDLKSMVQCIHQSNLQVALHAVEESTVEAASSILEHILWESPRINHRHRIEHCSVCQFEMAKRLASMGVMVVTQPAFIYYNGERYLKTVPKRQFQHLYSIATLLKAGIKVAAGSDCPMVPANPLIGIYSAVSRRAETGETVLPEECISPLEAIRMYTEAAAYASFEEAIKGSIAPGKLADLVVVSNDPTKLPIEEIKELKVEMTIIDGDIMWQKD